MTENDRTTDLVGWFYPPDQEDNKRPGILETDHTGRMQLRILNQYEEGPFAYYVASPAPRPWHLGGSHSTLVGVVSGTTASGRNVRDAQITLDRCHLLTVPWLQTPRDIRFIVNIAFIGTHVDGAFCQSLTAEITGIESWLNPHGPRSAKSHWMPAAVETKACVPSIGETEVRLTTHQQWSIAKGNTEELQETGSLIVKWDAGRTWKEAREILYDVHRFLCFSLNRFCLFRRVLIEVEGGLVEVVERGGRVHEHSPHDPSRTAWNALFTADYQDAGTVGDAAQVLKMWLEVPPGAKEALVRLHSLMTPDQFLDTQAVVLCGAAELWHKYILGDRPVDNPVQPMDRRRRKRIQRIFDEIGWGSVYERRIAWVVGSPNEPSLKEKLQRVFDGPEREVLELARSADCEVSTSLHGVRNPVVHGGPTRLGLDEMAGLVLKARAIFKLRVLEYLGVDWRTVAKYNRTLLWELGLEGKRSWNALPYPVYKGLGRRTAILRFLKAVGRPIGLQEIANALHNGGWNQPKHPRRVISYHLKRCMEDGEPVERTRPKGRVLWHYREQGDLTG
ncbi:MAG: hypothetical protein OXH70_01895 [Acidobacteria bacterium]|nr:hypothetical protein [Acidobacteriota bacterium]